MEPIATGKIPDGISLLSTLIELLADQEGVIITYTLTDGRRSRKKTTGKKDYEEWENDSE